MMSEKIKNYIGVAIIGGIVIISLSALSFVSAYGRSIDPASLRSFSVQGEGKVVAIPDIASFSFSVISESKDVATARKENIEKANTVIAFVKESGVEKGDIRTTEFAVEPKYSYYNCASRSMQTPEICPPPQITGYTVRQSVSVKVRDMEKAGDILGGVSAKGANSVSGLSFEIDDIEKVKAEARKEAVEHAKEKARALARAGGFSIGELIAIDEQGSYYPPMYYAKGGVAMDMAVAESAAPDIQAGSDEITVSVTLRYEIK